MSRAEKDAAAVDQRAEDALRANAPDLLAYLVRRMERQDAPDVLGEVFATAWRRRRDLPADPTAARMWLFGVARRTLANQRRSAARASALTANLRSLMRMPDGDAPHPGSEDYERGREVREAIAHLPPRQRELVRLVHWDGFSLIEAAQVAGIRASTARTHYARARERLTQLLAIDGESASASSAVVR